jgi:23S rRNA pseudouridine1911/1915/1917 synthase
MEKLDIVFEDEFLIVINKPAGLLTIASETERVRTAYAELWSYAARKRPRESIFIVHRLDREASGLIVFAKTPEVKEYLQNQFKDHSAGRTYIAVVEGMVQPNQFTVRTWLAENAALRVYSTRKRSEGKEAVTHIRVLGRGRKASLIEVHLETGRKHQIRVHMAERGHPIVGDRAYGATPSAIRRLALHGARLEFCHPRNGEKMRFESSAPRSFNSLL